MPRSPHSNRTTHSASVPRTASSPPRPWTPPRRVVLRTVAPLLVTACDGSSFPTAAHLTFQSASPR
ncbi:hypothetical protein SALBM311S_03077 [Streptomyces alboniger]